MPSFAHLLPVKGDNKVQVHAALFELGFSLFVAEFMLHGVENIPGREGGARRAPDHPVGAQVPDQSV